MPLFLLLAAALITMPSAEAGIWKTCNDLLLTPVSLTGAAAQKAKLTEQLQDLMNRQSIVAMKLERAASQSKLHAEAKEVWSQRAEFDQLGRQIQKSALDLVRLKSGYPVLTLVISFVGENAALATEKGLARTKVSYPFNTERSRYEVQVRDGLILDKQGLALDSKNARFFSGGRTHGRALYVMDAFGKIYINPGNGTDAAAGLFQTSSFLRGSPVACAGELIVYDGKILGITANDERYAPAKEHLENFVSRLQELGVDLSKAKIEYPAH